MATLTFLQERWVGDRCSATATWRDAHHAVGLDGCWWLLGQDGQQQSAALVAVHFGDQPTPRQVGEWNGWSGGIGGAVCVWIWGQASKLEGGTEHYDCHQCRIHPICHSLRFGKVDCIYIYIPPIYRPFKAILEMVYDIGGLGLTTLGP